MFGYYPRSRLVVVDNLVIDGDQRRGAAFYVFAQLLQDSIHSLNIEVDFIAVELEKGTAARSSRRRSERTAEIKASSANGQAD